MENTTKTSEAKDKAAAAKIFEGVDETMEL